MVNQVKKTALYHFHTANSSNVVNFSGFALPIFFSSILKEHKAVRSFAGLFDVSHMGQILISGKSSENYVQRVTTNNVSKLKIGQAQYSTICNDEGFIIDDIIVYKRRYDYMFVVNASNIDKKFNWLSSKLIKDVKIKNMSDRYSMIAIQGPKSREVIQSIVQEDISNLKFYNFIEKINCLGKNIMLSRTGYTGELGYEILCEGNVIVDIWTHIIKNFESSGLKPAGLGARDTLRIEMGYLLYGNDINLNIDPFKAGLGWITSLNKGNFIGKREIISKKNSMKSKIIYFEMLDKGIPRPGFDILINDKTLGHVTSGTISPSLNKGIGIGYLKKKYIQKESIIFIRIRDNIKKAKIVKPPFYTSGTLRY